MLESLSLTKRLQLWEQYARQRVDEDEVILNFARRREEPASRQSSVSTTHKTAQFDSFDVGQRVRRCYAKGARPRKYDVDMEDSIDFVAAVLKMREEAAQTPAETDTTKKREESEKMDVSPPFAETNGVDVHKTPLPALEINGHAGAKEELPGPGNTCFLVTITNALVQTSTWTASRELRKSTQQACPWL